MPRAKHAACARANNLRKRNVSTTIDSSPSVTPVVVAVPEPQSKENPNEPGFLDLIGALRGSVIIEDEGDEDCQDLEDDEELVLHGDVAIEEIHKLSALDTFNKMLQRAHDTAARTEREKEKGRKRACHYDGKANRTIRNYKKKRKDLLAKGFRSIEDIFSKAIPSSGARSTETISINSSDPSDSEAEAPVSHCADTDLELYKSQAVTKTQIILLAPDCQDTVPTTIFDVNMESHRSRAVTETWVSENADVEEKMRCQRIVDEMLENLWHGVAPSDTSEEEPVD
ncbi:hypothetical protein F5050DRAFT_1715474 [Lentinula boryana]|uniref:Uncharacterized protein n=1 Tax=Lentinula boryana TaxID=40481 RepID=A0ABQ8Q1D2_9AGAR|nr:hypothetical protein F5050DRAFT_1715474 [Lentinula boryana]